MMRKLIVCATTGMLVLVAGYVCFSLGYRSGLVSQAFSVKVLEWSRLGRETTATNLVVNSYSGNCTNSECGYARLVRIWIVMDNASSDYRNQPFIKRRLLGITAGSRAGSPDPRNSYVRLLPVLKGALDHEQITFTEYLSLRRDVQRRLEVGMRGPHTAKFSASVGDQERVFEQLYGSQHSSGRPRFSTFDDSCRDSLLSYLEGGQHVSAPEEHWIGIEGPIYLLSHGGRDPVGIRNTGAARRGP
jgi:hypothetical protein